MLPRVRYTVLTSAACLMLSLIGACSEDNRGSPTVPIPEFGTISGHVIGDLEGALAGVNVHLYRSGSQARATTTGVGGEFNFANVEIGSWTLSYEVPAGFVLEEGLNHRIVAVTANHETVIPPLLLKDERGTPIPQFGTLSGYILDDLGGALAGVTVRLSRSGSPVHATTTGFGGQFTFHTVQIGIWNLIYEVPSGYVLAEGLKERSVLVTANQETVVPPLRLNDHPVRMVIFNDGQSGKPGEKLPFPYWVAVSGTRGTLIGSVPIQWTVASGGGSIEPVQNEHASNGGRDVPQAYQGMVHVLGPSLGPQTVTATATTIVGAPTVTFTTPAVSGIVNVLGCTDTTDYCRGVERPAFSPSTVQIEPGQTVGWRWFTEFLHNVVFEDDPTEPVSSRARDDGSHVRKFDQATTVRYRCTFHSTSFTEGMVGTVIVK